MVCWVGQVCWFWILMDWKTQKWSIIFDFNGSGHIKLVHYIFKLSEITRFGPLKMFEIPNQDKRFNDLCQIIFTHFI